MVAIMDAKGFKLWTEIAISELKESFEEELKNALTVYNINNISMPIYDRFFYINESRTRINNENMMLGKEHPIVELFKRYISPDTQGHLFPLVNKSHQVFRILYLSGELRCYGSWGKL
jgi:hypothetical protein